MSRAATPSIHKTSSTNRWYSPATEVFTMTGQPPCANSHSELPVAGAAMLGSGGSDGQCIQKRHPGWRNAINALFGVFVGFCELSTLLVFFLSATPFSCVEWRMPPHRIFREAETKMAKLTAEANSEIESK